MTRLIRIGIGVAIILVSLFMIEQGVVLYAIGGGIVMVIWGLLGDTSTPENDPREISKSFKDNFSVDYEGASQLILKLHDLEEPWASKNCPDRLKDHILTMKNMATANITFTYGESLITKIKLSVTKSKDTFMVTIVGEGVEAIEFIREKLLVASV